VSRNFYWVPTTLTSFDWPKTEYTHTPAARHEDLTALTNLPPAKVSASAEIENTPRGRELRLHLDNSSGVLAFQISAAIRTPSGGSSRLSSGPTTGLSSYRRVAHPDRALAGLCSRRYHHADPSWNIASETITPAAVIAPR